MSSLRSGALGAFVASLVWCSLPSSGEAQQYQCVDNTQCPAGAVCNGGVCAYVQQPGAQVQVQTGYRQAGVQVQQGYPQQQQPQPQYYQQQPQYYPQQAPPPRQGHEEERVRWALLIPGIVALVGGYVSNLLVGLFAGFNLWGSTVDEWSDFRYFSLIPLLGPWIQMAAVPRSAGVDNDNWYTWLAIAGILEAGGLTMIILGAVLKERVMVYSEGGPGGFDLALIPQVGPTTGGLSLVGHF